jgi:SAM-dependent methyltransferase
MPDHDYFDQVRTRLASGQLSDVAFGALLPPLIRAKSTYHWTPLAVARAAAVRLAERGVRRVLDVGCGPGKFCVAAALARPELEFCGFDLSGSLTKTAQELTTLLRLPNVEFKTGDALEAPWHDFDGFYFFNPFKTDPQAPTGIDDELLRVARRLGAARRGTVVVTYHGLGGPIPSSYDLLGEEPAGSGLLRVWLKTRARGRGWYYLDYSRDVLQVPRSYVETASGTRKSSAHVASE